MVLIEKFDNLKNRKVFTRGSIRKKEKRTFLIESKSFGSVQVGIPPETIKTSINKGGLFTSVKIKVTR
jgi:hypothetical protein